MDQLAVRRACLHAGLSFDEMRYLGAGAWHHAWKVYHEEKAFVLRLPKKVAYGRTVAFDETALNAEYGGTALYYEAVNQAVPGTAPTFFKYYVSSELTYTIEEFAGENLNLQSISKEKALQVGYRIGEIYRKTEEIPIGLEGLGRLTYSPERGLYGQYDWDLHEFMESECEEFRNDYHAISAAYEYWRDPIVENALKKAFHNRTQATGSVALTNQDASPENILMEGDQIRLIDPYPILYYGPVMAGNFMNLYEMLFGALAETERYSRHRFAEHKAALQLIADGFLAGYCEGNEQKTQEVRMEQLLQVLETTMAHFDLLTDDEISPATRIRYGNEEMIQKRLYLLNAEMKRIANLIK